MRIEVVHREIESRVWGRVSILEMILRSNSGEIKSYKGEDAQGTLHHPQSTLNPGVPVIRKIILKSRPDHIFPQLPGTWGPPRLPRSRSITGPALHLLQLWFNLTNTEGFPGGASGKEPAYQCRRHKRQGFDPWVRKIPWRRVWQPTLVILPGESHGQRSLVDYSPKGCKESDRTKTA